MCGRYFVNEGAWDSVRESLPALYNKDIHMPIGDITPGMMALSLVVDKGEITAKPLLWGFYGYDKGKLLINARAESISDKPTFADSFRERRCVLPASGFYEWNKKKERITFTIENEPVIYLAGVFRSYGEETRFVILTREANASMLPFHDRMPLIYTAEEMKAWISDRDAADDLITKELPILSHAQEIEQLSLF